MFATKGHKLSELELSVLSKKKDADDKEKRRQKELAIAEAEIKAYVSRLVSLLLEWRSC